MKNFEELNLSSELLKALNAMNFSEMTKIQEESIPVILSGIDVIGQSQTGTGKTAAFGIPAVETADGSMRETQVLTNQSLPQILPYTCRLHLQARTHHSRKNSPFCKKD